MSWTPDAKDLKETMEKVARGEQPRKENLADIICQVSEAAGFICPNQPVVQSPIFSQQATGRFTPDKRPEVIQIQTGVALHFVGCQGKRCPLYMGTSEGGIPDCGLINLSGRVDPTPVQ